MVAFGHTAVGSAIGLVSYHYLGDQNPVLGLFLTGTFGVASHYIADFMPHGHFFTEKDFKKYAIPTIIFDFFLSILIFSSANFFQNGFSLKFLYLLFGIGGSQLPDVLDGLMQIKFIPRKGILLKEFKLHHAVHWHGTGDKTLMWSIFDIWQVLVVILSLTLIFTYS